MKELFREHFRDYVASDLGLKFDSLNEVQRSKYMARFYAEKVIRSVNPGLIPTTEEELAACIVDGSDDCGVDFLSREGDTVLILQAKFSGHKKTGHKKLEDPESFDFFCSVLSRLFAGPKKFKMNQKLKEARADIDWDHDSFLLHYITLAQPAKNSINQAAHGMHPVTEIPDLPERVGLELLDEQALNISLRDALSVREESSTRARVVFSRNEEQPPWLRFEDNLGRISYIGRIDGGQVAEIFRTNRSSIFSQNIRNYIGDNLTNRGIKATATNAPDDFFFYNNGISALSSRIVEEPLNRTLVCEEFSIINGAQTVRSLRKAHDDDASAVRDVRVLIRVTEVRPKQVEPDFLYSITKFNNTQNAIKVADFRSNDKVQLDLANKFERLPARVGKKFRYRNKRTGDREPNRIPVGMEEFTKTIHSFLLGPDDVFGGSQYLFDTSKDGGYLKVYGNGIELLPALTETQFKRLTGIWFICEYVKDLWKREGGVVISEALERRWMVFFAVGESMRQAYKHQNQDFDFALGRFADPNWYLEPETDPHKAVVRRHCKLAFNALKNAYGESSKSEQFRHRNWFRDQLTLASVHKQLESLWDVVSENADDYVLPTSKREGTFKV
jgi:AIPR protein